MLYATALIGILILGHACVFHFVFWRRSGAKLLLTEPSLIKEARYDFVMFDCLALLLFFTIAPLLWLGWSHLIKEISDAFQTSPADAIIALPPIREVGDIAALFLAIFGMCVPLDVVFRLLLRERYRDYLNASARLTPRQVQLLPWMNWGLCVFLIPLLALALHSYTYFRPDSIAFSPFLRFTETQYAYSEVAEIARVARSKAPNGNLKDRPHVAIRFIDGNIWTSIEGRRPVDPPTNERILQLLQDKTGLSPVSYDTFP